MEIEKLKGAIPDNVFDELYLVLNKFEINTPLRLSHFLAQAAHESGNFNFKVENLNYSASGLVKIFGKYFPTLADAEPYARKPEMIANKVYANRMQNGDEASGDGWKYRGRGYIQLTGKANYRAFNKFLPEESIVSNPLIVETKFPLLSAGWFWNSVKLNPIADTGDSVDVVTKVTKKINGGIHGLDDRISKFNNFYLALTSI